MTPTLSQFRGCILGLAVADAVAAPWEGLDAQLIYEMGPADAIVAHESRQRITYTDDTQMTIGVAEELAERGSIDVDSLAQRFAANYHPDRGYGQGARRIINAIGFGEDWRQLAATIFEGQGSLGNGAAMRVAPIGLFFAHDLQQVTQQAEQSALPTHTHPIGTVATALAARSAGERFRRRRFLEELRPFALTEEFQWQIDHALALEPFQSLQVFGNSLEANQSVMTSILCFTDSPDDYSEAISRAIGQGNDVDTLAAMTGALAGTRLGIEAVPKHLIDCLEDEEQGKTCLLKLAKTLSSQSVAE